MCDEAERRVAFLMNKCKEMRVRVSKPENIEDFQEKIMNFLELKRKAVHLLFDTIDADVIDKERFVAQQAKMMTELQSEVSKVEDYKNVLKFVYDMTPSLGGARPVNAAMMDEENKVDAPLMGDNVSVSFVAGVIDEKDTNRMRTLLFRTTRGNALTEFRPFKSLSGEQKACYVVVFQNGAVLQERV